MVFGDFIVIDGYSKNGGEFCTEDDGNGDDEDYEEEDGECGGDEDDDDCDDEECHEVEICEGGCICKTTITSYGPIRCITDRIIFHIHKWFNQAPTNPIYNLIHGIIKSIVLLFFDETSFEDNVYIEDLEDNTFNINTKIEIEESFTEHITDTTPYEIPPPGTYDGIITVEDVPKDLDIIIKPISEPWNIFSCFN